MNRKFISAVLALTLSGGLVNSPAVSAKEPYEVYNYDRWGEAVPSQAGYIADKAVSGYDLGIGAFSAPNDIFLADDGIFYIADTGNNRIVAVNHDFTEVTGIYGKFSFENGEKTDLRSPTGIFVSGNTLYIADSENSRVLVADTEGNAVREITKPDSEIYDSAKTFLPQKILADKAGNIYIVLNNITSGAAMFSHDGEFMGFYGANRAVPTSEIIGRYISDFFVSDKKKARRTRSVPSGITSFDIDGDFIFTCTSSSTHAADTVKKLNSAGKNIFADLDAVFGDYTPVYDASQNKFYQTAVCDIDISSDGNINCLDYTTGRVFQYDEDCNLLFITGTAAKQVGGFDTVSALESTPENLYVVDSRKNTVTIFNETNFGKTVHKASALHNGGYYEEALNPWYDVLKHDGNYRRAYVGVASALLRKGDYRGAMKYAKLADSSEIYNKAFEGFRNEWLKSNYGWLIFSAVILISVYGFFRKRKNPGKEEKTHDGT